MHTTWHLSAFVVVAAATVFPVTAIVAQQGVLDLNFIDLAEAVQEHSFLAVAFYSPGCGHCRRLLPSWTEAAELLIGRDLPTIRLARMDIASQGGRGAWKAFGLQRVPAVKVFVGNAVEPMPYRGHLDAPGIADHLAMLQRDRWRLLEREERLGRRNLPRKNGRRGENGKSVVEAGIRSPLTELDGSGVIVVALSSSSVDDASGSAAAPLSLSSSFRERFMEAVGEEQGLSLVLFVSKDSPKVPRMLKELLKAAPLLDDHDPPVRVVLVDLRVPSDIDIAAGSGGIKKRAESNSYRATANNKPVIYASARTAFMADVGVQLGEAPELRVFLGGKTWIDGGIFRGMPTADGIRRHMQWIAGEANLSPQKTQTTHPEGDKKEEQREQLIVTATTAATDGDISTSKSLAAAVVVVVDVSPVVIREAPAATNNDEAIVCITS